MKHQRKQYIDTNPCCPSEGAQPSDDTPLVIESGNKLPTTDNRYVMIVDRRAGQTYM